MHPEPRTVHLLHLPGGPALVGLIRLVSYTRVVDYIPAISDMLDGAYLEELVLSGEARMYLDEDGKQKEPALPLNVAATRLTYLTNPGLRPGDVVVGPAAVVGPAVAADPDGHYGLPGVEHDSDVPDI